MSQPIIYTSKEVMDIIDRAALRRMRTVEIAGFKGTWDIGAHDRPAASGTKAPPSPQRPAADLLGDYIIPIGKKLKGNRLSDVPRDELISFLNWLEDSAGEGEALSEPAKELMKNGDLYLKATRKEAGVGR